MTSSEGQAVAGSHESRRAFLPAAGLPLLYFAFAHVCLALALAVLVAWPDLPGGARRLRMARCSRGHRAAAHVAAVARLDHFLGWIYGTAGLIGFLAQIVVGIQGRLLPLHGWYRMMESHHMQTPERSAHTLASHGLAKGILVAWTIGVPVLAVGLTSASRATLAVGCAILLAGVALNAMQVLTIATAE